jgi:hypothetical protein
VLVSNPHLLTLTVRNVTPGKPESTTFTHIYVTQRHITYDFPCCTRVRTLMPTRKPICEVSMARYGFRACPTHS